MPPKFVCWTREDSGDVTSLCKYPVGENVTWPTQFQGVEKWTLPLDGNGDLWPFSQSVIAIISDMSQVPKGTLEAFVNGQIRRTPGSATGCENVPPLSLLPSSL